MRKSLLTLLLSLALLFVLSSCQPGESLYGYAVLGGGPLNPIEDSYVRSDKPADNFGTASEIHVDGQPIKITYLKFNLATLDGVAINSAKLRLKVTDSSNSKQAVRREDDNSWMEKSITFNTIPHPDFQGAVITTINGGKSGVWVEADITPYVREKADNLQNPGLIMSLRIDSTGSNGIDFSSRETTSKPELIIDVPGYCGDAICDPALNEDCRTCPGDCGACPPTGYCGDLICDPALNENCNTCETDCGACPPPPPPPLAQCEDGLDNDNDGLIDFGEDPGCDSLSDDDERDSAPPPPTGFARVTDVTSSKVSIAWNPVERATGYNIYLAPESNLLGDSTKRKIMTSLPSSAASYTIGSSSPSLSAATNVFIRVEAVGTSEYQDLHAKTLGYLTFPRTPLDNNVAEVHMVAPDILEIDMFDPRTYYNGATLDGNKGAEWQSATWTISRDSGTAGSSTGSLITVEKVNRHSLPVGQPQYWGNYDSNYVDVRHRIFIDLAENVGNNEILRVRINTPVPHDFIIPFSDKYLETRSIQLNQLGYDLRATERWAYLSAWLGDRGSFSFFPYSLSAEMLREIDDSLQTREVVTTNLPISQRTATSSASTGTEVRQIDLKSVPASELTFYRIRIPGIGISWRTQVSESGMAKAYYTLERALFLQRWCADMRMPFTNRERPDGPRDHCIAYVPPPNKEISYINWNDKYNNWPPLTESTKIDVVGHYRDAADHDIRSMHIQIPHYLMLVYELNPSAFANSDGQLNIPEGGNGVPDILDEAMWGIQGWEAFQTLGTGVKGGAEAPRHPYIDYATHDYLKKGEPNYPGYLPYYTYGGEIGNLDPEKAFNPHISARAAGLFAQMAYIIRPFNVARSDELVAKAKKALEYAEANGATIFVQLYPNSELYRFESKYGTPENAAKYKARFEILWRLGAFNYKYYQSPSDTVNGRKVRTEFALAYALTPGADPNIVSSFKTTLTSEADDIVKKVNEQYPHRNAGETAGWGQAYHQGNQLVVIGNRLILGGLTSQEKEKYLTAIRNSMDFVLGANPIGHVPVTRLGSVFPEMMLDHDSLAFIADKNMPAVPGKPVFGPASNLGSASYYQPPGAAFYPSYDSTPFYHRDGTNTRGMIDNAEFTVDGMMAAHAFNIGALVAFLTPNLKIPECWKPGQPEQENTLPVPCEPVAPPICGNGKCEAGESCSLCSADCGVCPTTECSDGVDNTDADALADYPNDKGCTSASDTSEVDGECDNRLDDDGDGKIDYPNDSGCDSYSDTDESNCGDLKCEGGETCSSCATDCGACPPGGSSTEQNFKVAFIGDSGVGSNAVAVLNLIKSEGADMVIHTGDLGYGNEDEARAQQWEDQLNSVLKDNFPYFYTMGNHDNDAPSSNKYPWSKKYLPNLQARIDRINAQTPGAIQCTGDLGKKSTCRYKGLFFLLTSPAEDGLSGDSNIAPYISTELANDNSIWSVCAWHRNMIKMQVGGKTDDTGWGVYENCRLGGAIVATSHEHSYARTKTLVDIDTQTVDPAWSDPANLRVAPGATFVFHSGIGGTDMRDQERCLPKDYPYGCNEWAKIYTTTQTGGPYKFGALFIEFNVDGDPKKAKGYFKTTGNLVIDEFTVYSEIEGPVTPPAAECNDSIDNGDADALIDYPNDPGCASASDTSEIDGECDDRVDNDGDGKIDYPADSGCDSFSDNDETNCGDAKCEGGETCSTCSTDCGVCPTGNTFNPIEDVHVRSDQPDANFGTLNELHVDGQPIKITYIKFDLTGVQNVGSAKLRLWVTDSSPHNQTVRKQDHITYPWKETTITYNTRQPLGSALGVISKGTAGTWVEVTSPELTSYVSEKKGGVLALGINTTASQYNGIDFSSREAANKPQLVIT